MTMQLRVKKLHDEATVPTYATAGAACFDLYACLPGNDAAVSTMPHPSVVIPTGLAFEIPEGHVMLVFSRSGHAFRDNVRLANCVGVIDSDYRGELHIKLVRDDGRAMFYTHKARVAQGMIVPIPHVEFEEVEELTPTQRGEGGFGSTGQGGA